jgi:hypothetical protein
MAFAYGPYSEIARLQSGAPLIDTNHTTKLRPEVTNRLYMVPKKY